MKKLQVIVVSYNNDLVSLNIIVNSFLAQTNKSWVMHLVHDGKPNAETASLVYHYATKCDLRFQFTEQVNGNYGHPNRRLVLNQINPEDGEFLLITNHDNYYTPVFVEKVLNSFTDDVDLVYCDFINSHQGYQYYHSEPAISKIDMGAFVTRTDLSKKSGFNNIEHFCADGIFLEDYKKLITKQLVHVPLPLFVHN